VSPFEGIAQVAASGLRMTLAALPLARATIVRSTTIHQVLPVEWSLMAQTILVADDDRVVTATVVAALKQKGYKVLVAHDAVQAFMTVRREKPAAVVIDIQMPGGTGLDAIKRIRSLTTIGQMTILAISGLPRTDIQEKAREVGADEFLPKPVDLEKLTSILAERLGPESAPA
jgi:CheY-like chemotaxis protein